MQNLHKLPSLSVIAGVLCWLCPLESSAIPIDGLTLGASEKGLYLGVDSNPRPYDLVELGVFYVDATVANIDVGLSDTIPVAVEGGGLRLSYSRFLLKTAKKSGPFIQAGLSVGNLSASSKINLDNLKYSTSGGTTLSCAGCGSLIVKTKSPQIGLIPSVALGWQFALGSRALLRVVAGAQYYDVPNVSWDASQSLPRFAIKEVGSAINHLNSDIEATSDLYPTASLSLTYTF